ncbi:MAG: phosphatidylglycerophosphatase A [Geminicoccaceae bacterium]
MNTGLKSVATLFGIGLLPGPTGTWGSLAALPPALILLASGGWPLLLLATIAVTILGWFSIARHYGARADDDPREVVVDELAGQWLALITTPMTITGVAAAFLAFRLFDIVKPWPASWADGKLKGPWGIMLDDLFAGIYAAASVTVLMWIGVL